MKKLQFKKLLKAKSCKLKAEQGVVALLITIIIMSVGVVIAVSSIFIFLNRVEASRNIGYSEQAYFAAESGIEDALLRLFDADKAQPDSFPYALNVGDASVSIDRSVNIFGAAFFTSQGNAKNRIKSIMVSVLPDESSTLFSFAAQIGERGLLMDSNATVNGNVYSNGDITGSSNTEINGDAIAVGVISSPNPEVSGTRTEGADAIPLPPFNAEEWEALANINNNPIIGDLELDSPTTRLGPRKIEGNLTLNGNSSLIVEGPIYITGNFTLNSNSDLFLDESFGSSGTAIIVEGRIEFNSNSDIHATSASPKGYLMLASLSSSEEAIEVNSNQQIEGAIYAVNGDIEIDSRGDITALIGNGVHLESNATLNYDLGLISFLFSSGTGSGYAIMGWKEQ